MLALDKLGILNRPVRANSPLGWLSAYDGNLVGGMMVGLGMSLSGACPGTVLVQLAQGIPSAKATAVGALLGGTTYVLLGQACRREPLHADVKNLTFKRTIPDTLTIPEALLYVLLGITSAGIIWVNPTYAAGGLLIGIAQAASLLLTASAVGVSTVYEHLGRYFVRALGTKSTEKPTSASKSFLFAMGIMTGSIALGKQCAPTSLYQVSHWQGLLGGFVMVFGARLAGGCTSGHGLSGLSALSFSSLVTAAGIFGAGILSRLI